MKRRTENRESAALTVRDAHPVFERRSEANQVCPG
jgi:hypothetical protein